VDNKTSQILEACKPVNRGAVLVQSKKYLKPDEEKGIRGRK
jgi:hypothetical protein